MALWDSIKSIGAKTKTTLGLDKPEKKAVVNPPKQDFTVFHNSIMSESLMKHPTKDSTPVSTPADFYRRGGGSDGPIPRLLGDPEVESPASIRLMGNSTDKSKGDIDLIPPYTKFFLESAQESHMERSQVVETFGDFYVFFFGERPPVYNYSGTLLNADNVNWAEDFYFYYDNFLRGTKCVEAKARLILTYGYRQVEGFMLSSNFNINAISERGVPFSFQFIVIDRKLMKLSLDFGLSEFSGKFNTDNTILQMLKTGTSDGFISKATNDVKAIAAGAKPPASTKKAKSKDIEITKRIFPASASKIVSNPDTGGQMMKDFSKWSS